MEKDELGMELMDDRPTESSSPQEPVKQALTFSVMPGFKCFFQDAVLRDSLSLQ